MDAEIIKGFCNDRDGRILHKLSDVGKAILVDGCFSSLFQKWGDQELAAIALQELGEIRKLKFRANLAKGLDTFRVQNKLSIRDAQKKWKKLSTLKKTKYRPLEEVWVYTGSKDIGGYLSLQRMGATAAKVMDKKELPRARKEFIEALRSFPEYKRDPDNPDLTMDGHPLIYTLGGFAALGNPSSFHNPYVREKREKMHKAVSHLFGTLIGRIYNDKKRERSKLELLPDRMLYRHKSQTPSAESWHRDVTPSQLLRPGDEVFGGWLNLDEQDQYLSYIPGSHLGIDLRSLKEGFVSLSAEARQAVKPYRMKFKVPPGHILIFPQYALHEVVSNKAKYDMMRIFNGWRVTVSDDFLMPTTLSSIHDQGIFLLPSGQRPPVYAANHASIFKNKRFRPLPSDEDWKVSTIGWSSETFKATGPTGVPVTIPHKGKPNYRLVPRFMQSLKHYAFPMYPPYTKEEIKLYRPMKITQEQTPRKKVRVAFFDLDETLICPCAGTKDIRLPLIPFYDDRENKSTIFTTADIMKLLVALTKSKDHLWYLVSRGRNKVKFNALRKAAETNGIGVITPNTMVGISQYGIEDKGKVIAKIMGKLKENHTVEQAVFIDDSISFREQVMDKAKDVEIFTFKTHAGEPCWYGDFALGLTYLSNADVKRLSRLLKIK